MKRPLPSKNERAFLKMSDRSSLFPNKMEIKSDVEKPMKASRSFINFASAVEQEKKKKCTNKVLKRASELLDIITLDVVPFDIIDVPPMKYETYIRTFGKSGSSQVFTQTENSEEEEAQTDVIEMLDKWTQYPPHDVNGCGGDNVATSEGHKDLKALFESRSARLSTFLQNCSNVILSVLDEEFPALGLGKSTKQRSNLFYSNSYHTLPSLNFLKDTPVRNVYCSTESCQYIITIYDTMIKVPSMNDERGILCVWNISDPQKPQHVLMSNGQPTCVTFGPFGNDVVIAGIADGAVVLWDLTDSGSLSYPIMVEDQVYLLPPTYNTAVAYGLENHVSCIVAIQAVHNYANDDRFSSEKSAIKKNFHVLTLEDMGIINVWVVVKVLKPDISGVDSDLGLAPGGKLRLVKSTSLPLYSLSSLPVEQKTNLRTFDFQVVPFDSSRLIVTTDAGICLHVTRLSGNVEPRYYLSDPTFSTEIRCLDFSPCMEDLFLVGCSDGSVKLFNVKFARPLLTLPQAAKGDPVNVLHWSTIHPAVFCVLSTSSTLYMWNIMKDTIAPVRSYHFADLRITWFVFRSERNSEGKTSRQNLNMILSKDNGEVEIHAYQSDVTAKEYAAQMEYMQNL
ncbi:cytoplasmic dynein 2 intermediate chain 1-like [Uloborus diversus]|uniref:cytoplasmic dynein 2 intermediate chain 1-like n=1 Tax=Uloborus diversus TaxID=327109 RepID=UPI0024096B67|nr:cytoplasmic dynein 2 intermediate chain 1-like [Uloborus diversus]